jgi:transposase-like protein
VQIDLNSSFRRDWDAIRKGLRPVNTAPTERAAAARFDELAEARGDQYPAIRLWRTAGRSSSVLDRRHPAGQLRRAVQLRSPFSSRTLESANAARRR